MTDPDIRRAVEAALRARLAPFEADIEIETLSPLARARETPGMADLWRIGARQFGVPRDLCLKWLVEAPRAGLSLDDVARLELAMLSAGRHRRSLVDLALVPGPVEPFLITGPDGRSGPAILLELVGDEYQDIETFVRRHPPDGDARGRARTVAEIAIDLAAALQIFHWSQLAFQDLGKRHLLLAFDGEPRLRLIDAGAARGPEGTLCVHDRVWTAPEQCVSPDGHAIPQGRARIESDVYLAGRALFLLTSGHDLADILPAGGHGAEDAVRKVEAALSTEVPALRALIGEMLQPDPGLRPSIDIVALRAASMAIELAEVAWDERALAAIERLGLEVVLDLDLFGGTDSWPLEHAPDVGRGEGRVFFDHASSFASCYTSIWEGAVARRWGLRPPPLLSGRRALTDFYAERVTESMTFFRRAALGLHRGSGDPMLADASKCLRERVATWTRLRQGIPLDVTTVFVSWLDDEARCATGAASAPGALANRAALAQMVRAIPDAGAALAMAACSFAIAPSRESFRLLIETWKRNPTGIASSPLAAEGMRVASIRLEAPTLTTPLDRSLRALARRHGRREVVADPTMRQDALRTLTPRGIDPASPK